MLARSARVKGLLVPASPSSAVWPGPVAWEFYAGLIVIVSGALARVQWAFYKKHLWVGWRQ